MSQNEMTSRLVALCFDANDPLLLAQFWAKALDWEIFEETLDQVSLAPTEGSDFSLLFLRVSETKTGKTPIHLDLSTTSLVDRTELIARLIQLGARHVDIGQGSDAPHVVLADPEGNEFCVLEPGNSFVDDKRRFGSITCDGLREVGNFWSQALGWPLTWDQDEETAIRAPDGTGPFITWGPPVAPKSRKNRLHLDIVPNHGDHRAEVARLTSLGAIPVDIGQGDVDWVVMADPEGNEFCVLRPDQRR